MGEVFPYNGICSSFVHNRIFWVDKLLVEEGYEGKKSKPEGDFKKYEGVLG